MTSRCRTSNFSLKERCIFIDLLVNNYPFLHEDKGHSKSNNDIRSTAWNDLTQDFHVRLADKNIYRTTKQLKTLYENIKHKIKRNIGQGFMQADVKTAKDIPLALFMQLKRQYEGEMGKCGEEMRGKSMGAGGGAKNNCEDYGRGRQNCGLGCKCRTYSNILSSKHVKKCGAENGGTGRAGLAAMLNSGEKVERWVNSKQKEIIVINNKTVIFNDGHHAGGPKKSQFISHLPPNIGVRYPKNLSKNIYELSESSEEEEEEDYEEEGEEEGDERNCEGNQTNGSNGTASGDCKLGDSASGGWNHGDGAFGAEWSNEDAPGRVWAPRDGALLEEGAEAMMEESNPEGFYAEEEVTMSDEARANGDVTAQELDSDETGTNAERTRDYVDMLKQVVNI